MSVLVNESHLLQPLMVLTVRWWTAPVGVVGYKKRIVLGPLTLSNPIVCS